MADMVNHPSHYNQNDVETIDIIQQALTQEEFVGFLKGNIIKYLDRHEFKNGEQDLEKAQWYSNKLLDVMVVGEHKGEFYPIPKKMKKVLFHTYLIDEYNHKSSALKHWKEYRDELSEGL